MKLTNKLITTTIAIMGSIAFYFIGLKELIPVLVGFIIGLWMAD